MYYYEKDYIMRLIHGIAQMLAKLLFNRVEEQGGRLDILQDRDSEAESDYLRRMVDAGKINAAENRLLELIESAAWEERRLAPLILEFYDYVNGKGDDFLAKAGFSRDEIVSGMEDALKAVGVEIPEYLRI